MLIVEQNVAFGLRLVEHAHVVQTGRVVYAGPVKSLDRKKRQRKGPAQKTKKKKKKVARKR